MSEGNGEVVSVRILPNDSGNPKGKLADAEVIFEAGSGPLNGAIGASPTLLVNVGLMTAGLYATLLALRRGADPALLKAVFAIYLALLVTVALALLLSIVTSTAVASVSTLCLVIAGRYSDVILNLGDVVPGMPAWALRAVMILIPNFRNFDLKDRVVYGDPVSFGDLGWITAYAAAYTGTVITLAVIAFRRRELT